MIFLFFILYFIFTLAEQHWIKNWSPNYYRYGIPLYRKRISLMSISSNMEDYKQQLGKNVSKFSEGSDIDYLTLSAHEMGFRVKYTTRSKGRNRDSYSHAILKLDPMQHHLTFTGYLSLTTVLFLLLVLGMFVNVNGSLSFSPIFIFFPAFVLLIISFSSIRSIKDYGRINTAIQHTFKDQVGIPQQSLSELQYPDPRLEAKDLKMPDIQTYDPFTTTSSNASDTTRTILIVILIGMLIVVGIVSVLFWMTYAGAG